MSELVEYIVPLLLIRIKTCFKEIRKKEEPHNEKEDEKFDQDDKPEALTHCHISEAIIIEPEYSYKYIFRHLAVDYGDTLKIKKLDSPEPILQQVTEFRLDINKLIRISENKCLYD